MSQKITQMCKFDWVYNLNNKNVSNSAHLPLAVDPDKTNRKLFSDFFFKCECTLYS